MSLQGLPPTLLPYLRLAHAASEAEIECATPPLKDTSLSKMVTPSGESEALHQLTQYLQLRLAR